MDPQRFQKIQDVFHDAAALSGAARDEYLRHACRGDSELHRAVEVLLRADAGAASGFLDPPQPRAAEGPRVAAGAALGDYEVLDEIARGGMGVVYRARQRGLGRIVALKLVRGGALASSEELARFEREARAVSRLDHPHIVPVHEVGEEDGMRFYSMKLMEGGTLARPLVPIDRSAQGAARIVEKVARAVHHAHEHGVLHRDLKPANILLDRDGEPHVSDFGLAGRSEGDPSLTASGQLLGTASYMSPEQAAGRAREVTAASDVYGLGAVLYELLTGRPPFRADSTLRTLEKVMRDEPERPRFLTAGVPVDLESICLKCLEKSPGRRYASAALLAGDLRRFLDGLPVAARRVTRTVRAWKWVRRHPAATAIIALLALLAFGSTAAAAWLAHAQRTTRENLRTALLREAQNVALAPAPGRSLAGLQAIRHAARIRPGKDLRDAAVACLAVSDLEVATEWEAFTPETKNIVCDDDMTWYARSDRERGLAVCRVGESGPTVRLVLGESAAAPPGPSPERGSFWAIAFSSDSRLLAVREDPPGRPAGKLWVYVWREGRPLLGGEFVVYHQALDFDPSGERVAFHDPSADVVRLVDLASASERKQFPAQSIVHAVRFSPDGGRLAHGSGSSLWVHDLSSNEPSLEIRHPAAMESIEWHPKGFSVATTYSHRLLVWDWSAKRVLRLVEVSPWNRCWARWSRSGDFIATTAWESGVRLWSAAGTLLIADEVSSLERLAFSRDDERFGVWRRGKRLGVWRMRRSPVLREIQGRSGLTGGPISVDPHGRFLAFSEEGGRLFLWDLLRWEKVPGIPQSLRGASFFHQAPRGVLSNLETGIFIAPLVERRVEGQGGPVLELRIGPPRPLPGLLRQNTTVGADGRFAGILVQGNTATESAAVAVVDLATAQVLGRFPHLNANWWDVSPGGKWFVCGPLHGRELRVWEVASGDLVKTVPAPAGTFSAVPRFSRDGALLAVSTEEGLSAYRTGSWEVIPELHLPGTQFGGVSDAIAVSPDSSQIAWQSTRSRISLTCVRTGDEVVALQLPQPVRIRQLEFAADGARLFAVTDRNGIQVWDLRRLRQELGAMDLDWDAAPLGPESAVEEVLRAEVEVSFWEKR
jgi:WD40 repeat protein